MKFVAALLLVLVSTFVGGCLLDACPDEGGPCPPACHVACVDGCTVAPMEVPAPLPSPLANAPDPLFESAFSPLDTTFPPEVFPPKA